VQESSQYLVFGKYTTTIAIGVVIVLLVLAFWFLFRYTSRKVKDGVCLSCNHSLDVLKMSKEELEKCSCCKSSYELISGTEIQK